MKRLGQGPQAAIHVLTGLIAVSLPGSAVLAQSEPSIPGAAPVVTLPEPQSHWVYITDVDTATLVIGSLKVVNGDTGKYLGTISSGNLPNFLMTPDRQTIYASETYYSRGSRGKRTDVVTVYDPRTLSPRSELPLPNGRFMSPGKKYALALSSDAKYLFSANMRPSTSVSVLDLTRSSFLAEISTPGCALAYPTGPTSFASICASGALMNVSFNATGEARKTLTPAFFNPDIDPVFDAPAIVSGSDTFYFISYHGLVFPIKRTDGSATPQTAWNILSDEERRIGWRPGGTYQLLTLHPQRKRLYALMHIGGEWTHKQSGTQVWVIDTNTGKVLSRNKLVTPADAIAVTLDSDPLLFSLKGGVLNVYSLRGDALVHEREVKRLGTQASFMSVPGEG